MFLKLSILYVGERLESKWNGF